MAWLLDQSEKPLFTEPTLSALHLEVDPTHPCRNTNKQGQQPGNVCKGSHRPMCPRQPRPGGSAWGTLMEEKRYDRPTCAGLKVSRDNHLSSETRFFCSLSLSLLASALGFCCIGSFARDHLDRQVGLRAIGLLHSFRTPAARSAVRL